MEGNILITVPDELRRSRITVEITYGEEFLVENYRIKNNSFTFVPFSLFSLVLGDNDFFCSSPVQIHGDFIGPWIDLTVSGFYHFLVF